MNRPRNSTTLSRKLVKRYHSEGYFHMKFIGGLLTHITALILDDDTDSIKKNLHKVVIWVIGLGTIAIAGLLASLLFRIVMIVL